MSSDVDTGDFEGLNPQEATDSDERFGDAPRPGYIPDENEYDPPDSWSGANRHGTTPAEEAEGETLDQRLREEQPDIEPVEQPERSLAETPIDQLDESVDEVVAERPGGDEDLDQPEPADGLGGARDLEGDLDGSEADDVVDGPTPLG